MPYTRPIIGLSPRLLRNAPAELGFRGKTLLYLEQSVADWVMSQNAIPLMIPTVIRDTVTSENQLSVSVYAHRLDGLILQGGADIHPSCYGESPKYPEYATDVIRDRFEMELLGAFIAAGKPVLGICRGMQLINVLFGGSLHQDLLQAGAAEHPHVMKEAEEEYRHGLQIVPDSWFSNLHGGLLEAQVNSIHHQGIDRLGAGLTVEAYSQDGVIEAIRHEGHGFVAGVQWHPEFHNERFPDLLSPQPLMHCFIEQAISVRNNFLGDEQR